MTRSIRLYFYYIFAIFFVITTPFLVIFSLGYDLNVDNRQLSNSLSISIDTKPRQSKTYNRNQEVLNGSGELRGKENQIIPLTVRHPGYLEENFTLLSEPNNNATVRISNLWLLPDSFDVSTEFDSNYKLLTLLSENYLLFEQNGQLSIQLYGIGGVQGKPEIIQNNIARPMEFVQKKWVKIQDTIFWDSSNLVVIVKFRGQWRLLDTTVIPEKISNIATLDDRRLTVLDIGGRLWIWDFENNLVRFIEGGIDGLAFTQIPDYIWIRKKDSIYRIVPNRLTDVTNLEDEIYSIGKNLKSPDLEQKTNFTIKTVFQGTLLKVSSDLYYIPDYDKSQWTQLADNAIASSTLESNAFWLDDKFKINSYNFFLNEFVTIPGFDSFHSILPDEINLSYYPLWRRIIVYAPQQVYAVWFDKDILNNNIIKYQPRLWLKEVQCMYEIRDRHQFCILENKLVVYKNTSIW